MADLPGPEDLAGHESLSEEALRREFVEQTATISWHELQPHYARGAVVWVAEGVDLVEVALQLRKDNKATFEQWIVDGKVSGISDELGAQLFEDNPDVWAVVVPPWVLVQATPSAT